jgi:hypothetical protein
MHVKDEMPGGFNNPKPDDPQRSRSLVQSIDCWLKNPLFDYQSVTTSGLIFVLKQRPEIPEQVTDSRTVSQECGENQLPCAKTRRFLRLEVIEKLEPTRA